jgi:hypothetical protein
MLFNTLANENSLFLQEGTDPFVLSHKQNVSAMEQDESRST